MNNKELFNEFKKQVAIYNFEQEEQRTDIYPLEKNTKEWGKYIMKKRILQTLAMLVIICTFGIVWSLTRLINNCFSIIIWCLY